MAQVTARLRCRFRWWVWPFVYAAITAAMPFWWAIDIDDYAAKIGAFVVKHGVLLKVEAI